MAGPRRLDDFEIVKEIGRGGFGVVYRAQQVSLDRPVALKVLYRNLIHTQEQISRFEREARAAARLDHPSIVSVYAWGEADDDFYIAQQLIGHGRTMADMLNQLREGTTVPTGYFRRAAEVVAEVAEALEHSHTRGIVHRDMKPSNILLDDEERPFLGDFGLAKVEDGLDLSRTGTMAGSPYYMSPEQADSERGQVTALSDVYSLGVTLYEMITLTQPFSGTTPHEIMRKILTAEPQPPSAVQPRVPEDLETICLKAMEKVPERRYASAAELAADLRAYLAGEAIAAVPISATRRTIRRLRRHQVPIVAGIIALTLAAGAFYYFQGQSDKAEDKAGVKEFLTDAVRQVTQDVNEELDAQIVAAAQAGDTQRVLELVQEKQSRLAVIRERYDAAVTEAEELGADFAKGVTDILERTDSEAALGVISNVLRTGLGLRAIEDALVAGNVPTDPAPAEPEKKPFKLFGFQVFGGDDDEDGDDEEGSAEQANDAVPSGEAATAEPPVEPAGEPDAEPAGESAGDA